MTEASEILEYTVRIQKAKHEIEFCQEQIDKLNHLTEICPNCEGQGKFMTIHRTFGEHTYSRCIVCRGKGKITKEKLEEYRY